MNYIDEIQEAKLQPKGKIVVYEYIADNSRKIMVQLLSIQYRHKKRCTNCQDHKEMKRLLKQKLKEKLQRTTQTARNKVSRTVGSVRLYRDLYREIVLARTDYISRTLLVHEKANGSDAHSTLGLEKTVLLMANHD